MHELSKATIGKINRLTDGALFASPDFLDYVADIDHAVREYLLGGAHCEAALADLPITAGNVALYPLTLSEREWLREIGLPAFAGRDLQSAYMQDVAVFFAMSSRPHDLFLLIPTIDDAREAVTEWARKVDTTYQALSEAAGMLMPLPAQSGEPCKACGQQIPESKPSTVRHSTGGLVAALCTETGMPRDFWMYHAGDEFRRLVIERINARLTAGQKGRVQEAGQAHAAFTWVKNDIVRRLKARAAA